MLAWDMTYFVLNFIAVPIYTDYFFLLGGLGSLFFNRCYTFVSNFDFSFIGETGSALSWSSPSTYM